MSNLDPNDPLESSQLMVSQDPEDYQKGRGKDTIFRITIRNQINLIGIADNKANMIISINTIIISLIIAFLGSGFSMEGEVFFQQQLLVTPLTLFLITCLISAVCAVVAAKPYIIQKKNGEEVQSLLFFGKIADMSLSEYMKQSKKLLKSKKGTYDQLITEQYYYGVILKRKYKWLGYAYTIFVVGLVLAVLTYLVIIAFI